MGWSKIKEDRFQNRDSDRFRRGPLGIQYPISDNILASSEEYLLENSVTMLLFNNLVGIFGPNFIQHLNIWTFVSETTLVEIKYVLEHRNLLFLKLVILTRV